MPKKSGLGKGLNALISESSAETGSSPKTTLKISQIKPNSEQPRKEFDEEALTELEDSIKQHGVLQPLLVRQKGKGYQLVAGERRYTAAKAAGLKEVPVIIKDINDDEVLQLALIENLQREDLQPLEEARAFKVLLDESGLTQTALAHALSKSRPAIANSLRLLDLPSEVQALLEQGALSAGHARALLALPTDDLRVKLAEKIAKDGLSVRETEALIPLYSTYGQAPTTRKATPKAYKRAAQLLRRVLKAPVRVRQTRGKNKIEIEFMDDEDLKRLLDLLISQKQEDKK